MNPSLLPPSATEVVPPRPTLVVAPHYDDETLGCGGLLLQFSGRAPVRVLFLSDGSGGVEEVGDRASYAQRRRRESDAAAARLGVTRSEHLGLLDGALGQELEAIEAAVERTLLEFRPALLLVPGPLEATSDHRAAFTAVGNVLRRARGGSALAAATADLTVLLYEVNHPGYPDLLVDVSAQMPALEEAIACYPSQLERHDYLGAAFGLRRFRALSLGRGPVSAEGYRRLVVEDFATRGATQLIRDLGGVPELHEVTSGPRLSVVVRTRNRPRFLREALTSIAASTYRRLQVVVVNDAGEPPALPSDFPFEVARVDLERHGGRAAAANAGIAASNGDFICFLDDDDLAEPEHFAVLATAVAAPGVDIAYTDAAVGVYELDGGTGWRLEERRLPYSHDFDAGLLLVDNYIPFNTLAIARSCLDAVGPLDCELAFFEDWDLLIRLSTVARFHHLPVVTCEYRQFRGEDHVLGEHPRQRSDFLAMKARVIARHAHRLRPEVLARLVDRLRADSVARTEELRSLRRDRDQSHRMQAATEDRYHRLNGAHAHLKKAHEALQAESAQLHDKIREDQEHLAQLYREITRLNELHDAMRGTKAWRWHERVQRWRGS